MSEKIGLDEHKTREEMIREILQDSISNLGDYSEDDDSEQGNSDLSRNNNDDGGFKSFKSAVVDNKETVPKSVMSSILSVSYNDRPRVSFNGEDPIGGSNSNSHKDSNSENLSVVGAVTRDDSLFPSEQQQQRLLRPRDTVDKDLFATTADGVVKPQMDSSLPSISNSGSLVDKSSSSSSHHMLSSQSEISGETGNHQQHQNDDSSSSSSSSPSSLRHNQQRTKQATGMSVRCHCNLASCVTNNYMCKSERRVTEDGKELDAGCFVEELENDTSSSSGQSQPSVPMWNGRVATARRGCIEMLSREKQEKCSDKAGDQFHCCTQDMCNYPKSFYPSPIHNLNSNRPAFDPSSSSSNGIRGIAGMTPNLDHQVWLRAAVIAVPICGLMILVVLIVVARRLLQSDDYKDARPYRSRKASSTASATNHHHPYHQQFFPPTVHGQRSPYAQDGFHVKPVYMETSEYLLPPSYCSNCQAPHASGGNSQPRSSAASYSHENNCRKNSSNNSETEHLVHSHGSSSSSGSSASNHHCHCNNPNNGGGPGGEVSQLSDDDSHHTRSFSWNSIHPPPSPVFSGSSPELPAVHEGRRQHPAAEGAGQGKKLNFLSKIGLSRSTQSDNNPLNSRPYNV